MQEQLAPDRRAGGRQQGAASAGNLGGGAGDQAGDDRGKRERDQGRCEKPQGAAGKPLGGGRKGPYHGNPCRTDRICAGEAGAGMMRRDKKRWTKGRMARELVYYCLWMLTAVATWAMILKTAAVLMDRTCDLSDVLVFAGAAFGGELLLLLLKRVFAKPNDTNDENGGT